MLYRNKRQMVAVQTQEQQESNQLRAVHVRGPAKAPVTVEEFGDFQCPPCGQFSEPLNQLERSFPTQVRLVFREYPLDMHKHAKEAAYAAEAAGLQDKFWEMHDLLYREQPKWSEATSVAPIFTSLAKSLELDVPRFQKDYRGQVVRDRVAADQKRADELKVTKTPTIFVNGQLLMPSEFDPAGLRKAVERELRSSSAAPPQNPQ